MPADTSAPQTASVIMPLGFDVPPATALADALGLTLLPFDLAGLTAALAQGQRCIVVWSDPASAVAEALRSQTPPSDAAQVWRQDSTALLALFARNRRRLLLVEAQLITRALPDDITRLQDRLGLAAPPRAVPQPDDLAAQLARLMSAHLSDLRPLWEELQASSLSSAPDTMGSSDLDPVAHALSALSAERLGLQDQLDAATRLHQQEADLLRATMADLSQALSAAADLQDQQRSQAEADALRLTTLDHEIRLLRDQLTGLTADMTTLSAEDQTQVSAARQTARQLGAEAELLRSQLADLSGESTTQKSVLQGHQAEKAELERTHLRTRTELDLVRAQLQALSAALQDTAPMTASQEAGLLRDQLVNVTALLRGPADMGHTHLGPAHVQIESAFAMLLSALVTETDLRVQAQAQAATPTT